MLDPPRHGPMRRVASGAVHAARRCAAGATTSSASRSTILDGAATGGDGGECDFVERIAAPFPLAVIAWILGVPRDDWELLFRWTNEVIGKDDPEYRATGRDARARRSSGRGASCTRTSRS